MEELSIKHNVDHELLINFLDESEESIATLDNLFVELEQQPKDNEIIGSIFRVAHSIKGLAAFLNFDSIRDLTHELETLLALIRDGILNADSAIIDCLLSGFDELAKMLVRVRANRSEVENEHKLHELLNRIRHFIESPDQKGLRDIVSEINHDSCSLDQISDQVEKLDDVDNKIAVNEENDRTDDVTITQMGRTMRVSEEKVDIFMHYVGDLIEISESFNLLQTRINNNSNTQLAREFKDINSGFNQLSNKLQKSLLEIRKVSARKLIQKIPRMARDLANSLNKYVKVEVTGLDVQIDKSMIEALESPINHLVRNCVDHGIESAQERSKAGKCKTGTIKIDITENGEDVIIKIEDDGAGIDSQKICKKAIEMGLVTADQAAQLSECDVLKFIFYSGFSTA
ncbi:MAG TPA: Hpt domain-containing protein, partial [Sedimentisphaerales bacterium]|nr:Hpt domain-containing protein [Sedimentisphaerales bacterium]